MQANGHQSIFGSWRDGVAILVGIVGSLLISTVGRAALVPTIGIAYTKSGATYTYNLTLGDAASSTTTLGSVWYAWVPGQDYLSTLPTAITSPAGWNNDLTVNGGGITDGYSIRWTATSAAAYLNPAGSLSGFSFQSIDSPSSIFGTSIFHTSPTPIPTSTFVAYPSLGEGGTSVQGVAAAVPEPASVAILAPMGMALLRRRRRTSIQAVSQNTI